MKNRISALFGKSDIKTGDGAFFVLVFFGFFIITLPAFLALFPGTLGYDTPLQLAMFMGEYPFTAGNPVAHTLLLGAVICAAEKLSGSWTFGMAVYSVLQWLIVLAALSRSFLYMKRRGVPVFIMALGYIYLLLSLPFHVLSFNATKDVLFGAFLLVFMVLCAEYLYEIKSRRKPEFKRTVILAASGVLVCLFRNPCVYVLLAIALLALVFRRRDKGFIAALVSAAVLSLVFNASARAVFDIAPGGRSLPLFIPAQQLGTTAAYRLQGSGEVELSDEELEAILDYLPEELLREEPIHPFSADTYFAAMDEKKILEDPGSFFKLWLEVGLKNKGNYYHSARMLMVPYFDADQNPYRQLAFEYPFPGISGAEIERHSLFPPYLSFMYSMLAETEHIPFLLQPGLGIWLMLLIAVASLIRRDADPLISVLPGALYFCGWLIGPVALLRYLYPIVIAVPFFLGALAGVHKVQGGVRK
ncbi:MAG: hypothetical protein IKI75_08950 [Lachnospiraceae bacterium]|nr:hypothetical protein [Lachnospiraceae bacterium]